MASSQEFVAYVCEQARGDWSITSKKMFGEYMIYADGRPVLLVCDERVFVKMGETTAAILSDAETGYPYAGAKAHYVLDPDDAPTLRAVIAALIPVTPLPRPRRTAGGVKTRN